MNTCASSRVLTISDAEIFWFFFQVDHRWLGSCLGLNILFGKVQGTSGLSPQGHDRAIRVYHPNISLQGLTRLFSLLLPELGKEARARQGVQACLQDLKSQREITGQVPGFLFFLEQIVWLPDARLSLMLGCLWRCSP